MARVLACARRHPDLVAVAIVAAVALAIRAAFALRVPALVTKDSLEYLEPALNLLAGDPLNLPQRRTPVYALFIAGAVGLLGRDLLAITFAQHLLGVGTALCAFVIGRLTFGRAAGLLAGLLTALSGPLLIYEHYLITESVFSFLLVAAVALFVSGTVKRSMTQIAFGGLTLGLAALTRPVGQAVLLVAPIIFCVCFRRRRPTIIASALAVGCFALLVVPWAIRNRLAYGEATAASMGRFLISRSVKHERSFVFFDKDVGAYAGEDPNRTRARQIAQEVTSKRPEPGQVFQRIRDEIGLTEAQTDAMLRDIALEAILRDRWLWAQGTLEMFVELIEGANKEESVAWHLEVHDQPRVANQWGRLAYLLGSPTQVQSNELDRAERLGKLFRPTQWWQVLVALYLAGVVAAIVKREARAALLPALVAFGLLAASAALVGSVPRYRYPSDPLVYSVAAGGLVWLLSLARLGAHRFRAAGVPGARSELGKVQAARR